MTQRYPLIPVPIYCKLDPEAREFFNNLLEKLVQQQPQVNPASQNSSVPQSTQHPHTKSKPKTRPKSKRKRGSQPGLKQATGQLLSTEQSDSAGALKPISKQFGASVLRGAFSGNAKLMGICEEFYAYCPMMSNKRQKCLPSNSQIKRNLPHKPHNPQTGC